MTKLATKPEQPVPPLALEVAKTLIVRDMISFVQLHFGVSLQPWQKELITMASSIGLKDSRMQIRLTGPSRTSCRTSLGTVQRTIWGTR